ncbi:hypothetical protein JTB14_025820 [Gonioctena quinquepunctata]|nr:hypothetical protein JTB14_025820 [Gonioctena quinquepunctata]
MGFIVIFLLCLICSSYSECSETDKICTEKYDKGACNNIARDQNFTCTEQIESKTDCFLNIDQGLPQFAVVYPEQALLASPLVSDRVIVIGEVNTGNPPYQTAVIIRKPYDGGFENLKGKRFCHPGDKHDELVTRYVLEEFESKIISLSRSYCNTTDNVTIAEKRTRALADFLGPSCRPGSWSDDEDLDSKLKSKYSRLCELCGSEKCALTYSSPFEETLNCLTQNKADLALTTLRDALVFFNQTNNADVFQFLCKDGTVRDSSNPCTWTDQLNRLVITGKDVTTEGFKAPRNYLEATLNTSWADSLRTVLDLSKSDNISFFDGVPLKKFVEAKRTIPTVSENIQCNVSVKWCTLNETEQQKCIWLQQAALNSALQPVIECVRSQENDGISCLNDIQSGVADLAFNDVSFGYIALKKGLTFVAYPETDNRQLSSIIIVVRNDTNDITSLRDLKGKKACIPEYGGKEWLAFIDSLRSNKIVENSCDYNKLFGNFVGNSCVPGARSNDYILDEGCSAKLCEQCIPFSTTLTARYCNANTQNKYYSSEGSLRCLADKQADYAVITVNDISLKIDTSLFRVLSKNGSLSERTGIIVDENAPLTIITAGGVVVRNDTAKKDDIVLLLRGIEKLFGESLHKIFKVFESFNGTKDLLFPDSTPGLSFTGTQTKYVENFQSLLRNSEKCLVDPKSMASYNGVPSTILLILVEACTGLSSSELRAVIIQKRTLVYFCQECRTSFKNIPTLLSFKTEFTSLKKEVDELKNEMKTWKDENKNLKSEMTMLKEVIKNANENTVTISNKNGIAEVLEDKNGKTM